MREDYEDVWGSDGGGIWQTSQKWEPPNQLKLARSSLPSLSGELAKAFWCLEKHARCNLCTWQYAGLCSNHTWDWKRKREREWHTFDTLPHHSPFLHTSSSVPPPLPFLILSRKRNSWAEMMDGGGHPVLREATTSVGLLEKTGLADLPGSSEAKWITWWGLWWESREKNNRIKRVGKNLEDHHV